MRSRVLSRGTTVITDPLAALLRHDPIACPPRNDVDHLVRPSLGGKGVHRANKFPPRKASKAAESVRA
jgi:hypothetical protein